MHCQEIDVYLTNLAKGKKTKKQNEIHWMFKVLYIDWGHIENPKQRLYVNILQMVHPNTFLFRALVCKQGREPPQKTVSVVSHKTPPTALFTTSAQTTLEQPSMFCCLLDTALGVRATGNLLPPLLQTPVDLPTALHRA